jgi:hypothetical protein
VRETNIIPHISLLVGGSFQLRAMRERDTHSPHLFRQPEPDSRTAGAGAGQAEISLLGVSKFSVYGIITM